MSILIDRNTPVIVQGITGKMARFHTADMVKYGTNVVGGVVPGKGGMEVEGLPVFDTVAEAVEKTGAEASLVFVPPPFAANQTFSLHKSRMPPKLSDASFKKHEIGNPLFVPPFDKTGVAGMNQRLLI